MQLAHKPGDILSNGDAACMLLAFEIDLPIDSGRCWIQYPGYATDKTRACRKPGDEEIAKCHSLGRARTGRSIATGRSRGPTGRHVAETLAGQQSFDTSRLRAVTVAGRDAASNGDLVRLIELDLKFHTQMYEAIGNRVLFDVMKGQWAHIRRVMAVTLTVSGYRERVWDEHADIVAAIEAHDMIRAGAAAEAHTHAASLVVLKNFDQFITRDVPNPRAEMVVLPQ